MKKCVFLDRDGTINKEVDYLYEIEKFEFEDDVPEAIATLNQKGYLVIVVTNQSGIGRGLYSEEDMHKLHVYMANELAKRGAHIDDIYFCPHAPEDNCNCRKPSPELFFRAAKEHNIDLKKSYLVGDRIRDIIPAEILGADYAMIATGHFEAEKTGNIEDKRIFQTLLQFASQL